MPKDPTERMIIDKILDAIVKAQKDYVEWSGGYWLWNAPEYMLNIYIAQKITGIDGVPYLTLESGMKSAMDDAGATGKSKLDGKIRPEGRCDILLWWADETPRAVIEVKNQISSVDAIKADLERISGTLQRNKENSSFECGVMAYYTSCRNSGGRSAEKRLVNRIDDIKKGAVKLLDGKSTVESYNKKIRVKDNSAWTAAALLIK